MVNHLIGRKKLWLLRKILSVGAWTMTAVIMLTLLPYSVFSYVVCVVYTARILAEVVYLDDSDYPSNGTSK